jgi:hypothetical protein
MPAEKGSFDFVQLALHFAQDDREGGSWGEDQIVGDREGKALNR